jgi:hypothetical protein
MLSSVGDTDDGSGRVGGRRLGRWRSADASLWPLRRKGGGSGVGDLAGDIGEFAVGALAGDAEQVEGLVSGEFVGSDENAHRHADLSVARHRSQKVCGPSGGISQQIGGESRTVQRVSAEVMAMTAPVTTRTDDDFLALIYADQELLEAEFDALVAAEWPDELPIPEVGEDKPCRSRKCVRGPLRPVAKPGRVTLSNRIRERSPPG